MFDDEDIREELVQQIYRQPQSRESLEVIHGPVWDTEELVGEFDVIGFAAPFVVVIRKTDGVKGSLLFQHTPRLYYAFRPSP